MTPRPKPREPDEPSGDESELPRKERVIHTRVPLVLERELKRMAAALRVPVSNVVRTILEDAVDAVDRVGRKAEGEVRGIAESLAHSRGRLRGIAFGTEPPEGVEPGEETGGHAASSAPSPKARPSGRGAKSRGSAKLEGIIGFQPLALAQAAACAACGRKLRAGEQAYLGVRTSEGPPVVIGEECLPARLSSNGEQ